MHIVVFGLTVSSSWGNGHATLWRSLIRSLVKRGHTLTFYERDAPYYASTRDMTELPHGARLRLYDSAESIQMEAAAELAHTDLALCTSFCPDGAVAAEWILSSKAHVRAFYDMDTPVTLQSLEDVATCAYLPAGGLRDFDLVLSYTGGRALEELQSRLGARNVAALYGWVDPDFYRPVAAERRFHAALSYLGTYAADRQAALEELLLTPAGRLPNQTFLIGGAQYPPSFPWAGNVNFTQHLEPAQHPAFFCSGRATLNITRGAMAAYGYCPSGRMFEATACGAPLVTDTWEGLEAFFTPGDEIIAVRSADDVCAALLRTDAELRSIADAARARTLSEHTADVRVRQLESLCDGALRSQPACDAVGQPA